MNGHASIAPALIGSRIIKRFHRENGEDIVALDNVSLEDAFIAIVEAGRGIGAGSLAEAVAAAS